MYINIIRNFAAAVVKKQTGRRRQTLSTRRRRTRKKRKWFEFSLCNIFYFYACDGILYATCMFMMIYYCFNCEIKYINYDAIVHIMPSHYINLLDRYRYISEH